MDIYIDGTYRQERYTQYCYNSINVKQKYSDTDTQENGWHKLSWPLSHTRSSAHNQHTFSIPYKIITINNTYSENSITYTLYSESQRMDFWSQIEIAPNQNHVDHAQQWLQTRKWNAWIRISLPHISRHFCDSYQRLAWNGEVPLCEVSRDAVWARMC